MGGRYLVSKWSAGSKWGGGMKSTKGHCQMERGFIGHRKRNSGWVMWMT